jgi:DNA-binding LacI/PurR family transcriptional regulator
MKKPTARQVAQLAGVSQTTVSFVLNNVAGSSISEATRERVLQAARALGYVPTAAARTLASGRSSNLALVLVQPHPQVFADPYIPNIITGLRQSVQKEGFRILVEIVDDLSHLDTIESLLRSGEAAGVMVSGLGWGREERLMSLLDEGYPLVSIDHMNVEKFDIPMVTINHLEGVRRVVSHLVGLGHRKIACIAYSPDNPHVQQRISAYCEVLNTAGITYDPHLIRYGAFEPESGYETMQSLLSLSPTAVYGMNDMMALGAMGAIREAALRIPEDIAVVGYDDMRFSRFTAPPLTTVHAPEIELGEKAGQLLLDLILDRPIQDRQIYLESTLVIRQSCGGKLS